MRLVVIGIARYGAKDDAIEINMSLIERIQQHVITTGQQEQIYPHANFAAVQATEARLGFKLPSLLRDLLTQVGNGGFGPGYGILGVTGSDTGGAYDEIGYDKLYLGDLYLFSRQTEQTEQTHEPMLLWPEQLIPFCHWGCAIYSCLDCSKPEAPIIVFDPNLLMKTETEEASWDNCFLPHKSSFVSWLEAWMDNIDLWAEFHSSE